MQFFSCQTIEGNVVKLRLIGGTLLLVIAFAIVLLHQNQAVVVHPKRVEPLPQPVVTSTSSPRVATQAPIAASPIVSIKIPAIGVDAAASGPTMPRVSPLCKASTKCMDPPVLSQIAWSGAYGVPALPSTDAVLVYGHSNYHTTSTNWQVFNNLPTMVKGDKIVLTTKTGIFTYVATGDPLKIPFDQVGFRQSLYMHTPGRLVLFTCGIADSGNGYSAASVVIAQLISAQALH